MPQESGLGIILGIGNIGLPQLGLGDECGNTLSHELGHSQTMGHFVDVMPEIADEYPLAGVNMPSVRECRKYVCSSHPTYCKSAFGFHKCCTLCGNSLYRWNYGKSSDCHPQVTLCNRAQIFLINGCCLPSTCSC